MTQPKISVVMCAYTEERWEIMLQSIAAIWSQTLPPFELILVIDHNPALYQLASQHLPDVTLVENIQPPGLSGARNSGLAVARGEIIAFIDEDAIPHPGWLEQISRPYHDSEVIGVGGAIQPQWQEARPAWFPAEFDWVIGCTYVGLPQKEAPVRNLIGCNMSFRREVFEKAGNFRYDIGRVGAVPSGCEETELCIRALHACPGTRLIYHPGAVVTHSVPSKRGRWAYFSSRCYAEGRSKALVARYVGSKDGLAAERSYTLLTLPKGIWKGLVESLAHHKKDGALRSAAILAGLALTTAGYLSGRLVMWRSGRLAAYTPQPANEPSRAYEPVDR